MDGYGYPRWLLVVGVAAWLLTIYLGWESITGAARTSFADVSGST